RAALDVAIYLGIEHGGWCPRGRVAEDGGIPAQYFLVETESAEYWVRTDRNVAEADATLILHRGPITGGTELTRKLCLKHRRPHLAVELGDALAGAKIVAWLQVAD